ncbi:MAG: HAD-IA family hydrolase [Alcaligenaceae bacterium]|nr:HAD-IA family hydrolase [Alcaligenaceae bacterium]
MRYSLVVFDWDGTVIDSTQSIVQAIQSACRDLGLEVPAAAQARWIIGLSLESALYKAVPALTPEILPEFINRYRFHYLTRDPDLCLFNGMIELLDGLKQEGVMMAVATGKSRVGLDRVLAKKNMGHYFAATRTADETFSKPHPQMLNELMETLFVEPENTVMIGDTTHDVLMAHNAGVDSIAVTYGAHNLRDLNDSKPTRIVDNVGELEQLLSIYSKSA